MPRLLDDQFYEELDAELDDETFAGLIEFI